MDDGYLSGGGQKKNKRIGLDGSFEAIREVIRCAFGFKQGKSIAWRMNMES